MEAIREVNWQHVREEIKKVNPIFFNLVEEISSTHNEPLYLASYKYGTPIGIKNDVYIPDNQGGVFVLGKNKNHGTINQDLEYGSKSLPLGMILENYCEWFYQNELTNEHFPYAIQGKGTIFNQQIIFNEEQCVENNTISVSSGAKSIFMLPYIGCQIKHERLKSLYPINSTAPKTWHEHYALFNEIISCKNQWFSKILFFSKAWIEKIRINPEWIKLKLFFSENLRKKNSLDIYNDFYNNLFMTNECINKYRPTPFLVDSAKWIFSIIIGKGLGFKPATDNQLLPLNTIQEAYAEHYQLPYTPTVMIPSALGGDDDSVYYSLQQPSSMINTFKIRMNNSTYRELVSLKNIVDSYLKSFLSEKSKCYGSLLYDFCKKVKIEFFHNKPTEQNGSILQSKYIEELDNRFKFSFPNQQEIFSSDAKFFRGCIKISRYREIL